MVGRAELYTFKSLTPPPTFPNIQLPLAPFYLVYKTFSLPTCACRTKDKTVVDKWPIFEIFACIYQTKMPISNFMFLYIRNLKGQNFVAGKQRIKILNREFYDFSTMRLSRRLFSNSSHFIIFCSSLAAITAIKLW